MRVGVVGLGIMGSAMAERLVGAGHSVSVHNRTREKAEPLLARGASWFDTPRELAAVCEVVISMVTDPAAVETVALAHDGILAGLPETGVHCDMSTVSPAWSLQMAATYGQRQRRFVQAPVLGSKRQIQEGTLLVFGGGAAQDVELCEGAWRAFSSRVWRFDSPDQAASVKLACNMLLAQMILGLGQSLVFARKSGVGPATFLEILQASAMASPMFASKGRTLLERNFAANFVVRNMLKDLSLAADAGREAGAPLPLNGLARELFLAADQQGWGEEDYSAAVKVLEFLAGIEGHQGAHGG